MRSGFVLLLLPIILFSCSSKQNDQNTLIVFHAGSLSSPLRAAVDSFIRYNPKVKIWPEAAGSVECARKIADLNRPCDLFFSADYRVINNLLVDEHTDFFIPFATNRMVIAYSHKSRYADTIDSLNWSSILLRSEVAYGRSDPNSDPCGYRTLLLFQLAEKYYRINGLTKSLQGKDNQFIRPKEVDLLALLETSAIDYLFIYESIAKQHDLLYVPLPDSINLGNFFLAPHYGSVQVKIRGNTPNDSIIIAGEPIVYALTIPKNAPNPQLACKFANFFLSDSGGMKIITQMGQQSLIPFSCSSCGSIPDDLKEFIR